MAEALVSPVVEQLVSTMARETEQEVRLVVGVKDAVEQLERKLTAIQAVLADAERRQVRDESVRVWLEELKDVAYDIEDVLDDWEAAILSSQSKPERKVCSLLRSSCFCCKQVCLRHDIARKIKELNGRLDRIAQEKDRYQFVRGEGNPPIERSMTTSMIDLAEVTGREETKNVLVNMLLSEPSDDDVSNFHVLSIVGMGGIGKTTLAQSAFNDDRIKAEFDKKIWVCVSDPFDETRVAKAVLESLLGSAPDVNELESLLQKIEESVKNKKFLLVLDDVWEENSTKWNRLKLSLRSGSSGSKVLVTSRKVNVASTMGCSKNDILPVEELTDEQCWLILSKIAFSEKSPADCKRLKEIGKKIASKCKGLPLAAKALGSTLRFRTDIGEWQYILDSDIWEVQEGQSEIDVIPALWLSYNDLSPILKRCFSYCAIFPKDYKFEKAELIELWIVQGFFEKKLCDNLEVIGKNYFENLIKRSFFQEFEYDHSQRITSCKMHDMVHDLAQVVGRNECVGVQVKGGKAESISKVRHLGLDFTNSDSLSFKSLKGTEKLRSLFIWGSLRLTTEDLSQLFRKSTHLRSLCLRDCYVEEIPSSIRKLVHLRWLDLSNNRREEYLPRSIGKLINLRHLHNGGGPSRLPKRIAQLTCLRTLEEVNIGRSWYDVFCLGCDCYDAFSLGDLKNLNQLQGKLQITGLGACDRHVGEAKQAELKKKEHITELNLWFSGREEERCTPRNEELLLEALEPSSNLGILGIWGYEGITYPGWMILLTNLRSIYLGRCEREHVPSLGKLPSLETLVFGDMLGVKKVGVELLGIEEIQMGVSKNKILASTSSSSISSPPIVVVVFPKLTTLKFNMMYRWEEWNDYYDDTTKSPSAIQIMPSLHSLEIKFCKRLKALPDYILRNTNIQSLKIMACTLLKERYNKETGEDWSKISHISQVIIHEIW